MRCSQLVALTHTEGKLNHEEEEEEEVLESRAWTPSTKSADSQREELIYRTSSLSKQQQQ